MVVDLVPESVPPIPGSWRAIDMPWSYEYYDPSTFGTAFVRYSQAEEFNYIEHGRWYHPIEGTFTIDRVYEQEFQGRGIEEVLEGRVETRVKATEPHDGYPDEYMIRVRFTLFRSTPVTW
ncbi:MAG: hypothetical protein EA351_01445 [Gemmatimonadales bacterium]|nr:MAG: hypothetical protein EA351_01445 [Gemmatimonadales bacterium]